jgi:predicted NBD/HSP70 family sugar kinase
VELGIQRLGPISRVQLANVTKLSVACVCRIVDELLGEGVVVETGTVVGRRGRPMVLLDINPDAAPLVGIWLGPEAIEIGVASAKGGFLAYRTIPYNSSDDTSETVVPLIVEGIQRCVEAAGRDPKSVRGIGISVAALIDPMLGVIDDFTNRPGWNGVPLARLLSERTAVPVFAENDVRAGALGSQWFSEEGRDGNALYVLVCEGIGGAIIYDYGMICGVHDTAGMIGHATVDPDGPRCGCGNHGCLEAMASDIAFIRYLWPELAKSASEMLAAERVDLVQRGLAMAKAGDPKANWALVNVAKYLGIGLANSIVTLDPRSVFVCGTLTDYEPDLVIDLIRREAVQRIYPRARGVEIKAIPRSAEFLLRGSIALVLWQPYRELNDLNVRPQSSIP